MGTLLLGLRDASILRLLTQVRRPYRVYSDSDEAAVPLEQRLG